MKMATNKKPRRLGLNPRSSEPTYTDRWPPNEQPFVKPWKSLEALASEPTMEGFACLLWIFEATEKAIVRNNKLSEASLVANELR